MTGLLSAGSEQEVVNTLADRALFPTRIALAEQAKSMQKAVGRRVRTRHLSAFYSQLADLLHSGVPLLRSLQVLEQMSSQATLSAVLQDVREQVEEGTRLADAFKRHPRVFPELAVSMIRAGEEGGFLEEVLKRIAMFTEHQEDLKNRVIGAMAYPLFLIGASVLVVSGMLVFLVPRFAPIFERLQERGELPWPTQALMAVSGFLQQFGLWVVVGLGLAIWQLMAFINTPRGRLLVDTWRIRLKGIGPIIRSLAIARFCRILGTLLRNGVPILPALRISKDATGNQLLSNAIGDAAENISSGKSLARPLAASGQFSREVVEMISVGEEANNLEQVLLNIADNMEVRTYRQLELFVKLLEPMMLLVMAVVILFVMIALLMPVLQNSGGLG